MNIAFSKYQGAGNDFILIDHRTETYSLTTEQIAFLCDRHFGIGADGLMLLKASPHTDFEMVYYNADGGESTMCGNGGRCIAAFAARLGIVSDSMAFTAVDGTHHAVVGKEGMVDLQMQDVEVISFYEDGTVIMNTGSPHFIKWVGDIDRTDVVAEGRAIRNEGRFQPKGINVNFASYKDGQLLVRTYERGVEDETLACGTGVTAVAIAAAERQEGDFKVPVKAKGGNLVVAFTKDSAISAKDIVLSGPAMFVFDGSIDLQTVSTGLSGLI